ncbi:MAG: xylulokinase [Actinobacteria bacterium]|nr:xylulokinase [Actinomycetota bacterium]
MTLVAGIDSSTQSTKVVLCDAEDGTVVGTGSAPHPSGTEVDPQAWWDALQRAGDRILDRAAAIAVAGQQHGSVLLDRDGQVIRPALLWNDMRSADAAASLVTELGGPRWWADVTGSVPTASFTVTKLRWLAAREPANAARVARVMLPHDWLTWRLGAAEPVTDRGDASGTGYFATPKGQWLPEVAAAALGHEPALPRVAAPGEAVGQTAGGAVLGPGTGDNMAAALGLGLGPGEVAVSIGTSGTAFAVTADPAADPSGAVAGFADATGQFLPLVCTINAGLVLSAAAAMTGTDLAGLAARALAAEPGASGVTLLPYFDGERTPNLPLATGVISGLTTANGTAENLARAAIEGVLCSLAEAVALLGGEQRRVLLIGGGARSPAVCALAPGIFGADVEVPAPEEYVALGAARQAAWALAGTPQPPSWPRPPSRRYSGVPQAEVRDRYAALRAATSSWAGGVPPPDQRKESRP